jgi:hypothetical protein
VPERRGLRSTSQVIHLNEFNYHLNPIVNTSSFLARTSGSTRPMRVIVAALLQALALGGHGFLAGEPARLDQLDSPTVGGVPLHQVLENALGRTREARRLMEEHGHDHSGHACAHDAIQGVKRAIAEERQPLRIRQLHEHASEEPLVAEPEPQQRDLGLSAEWTWVPVRVQTSFVQLTHDSAMTENAATALQYFVVPQAIQRIRSVLEVKPTASPFFMQRECQTYWQNSQGKCSDPPTNPTCNMGTGYAITPPPAILGPSTYYPDGPSRAPTTLPAGGSGLPNTDYVFFVTALSDQTVCTSATGVLAYAGPCQRDSDDRPIAGTINFCPVSVCSD